MSSASTEWAQTPVWAAPADEALPPGTGPLVPPRRRRRRRVRLVVLAICVLLVALVATERFGRSYAAGQITDRLRSSGVTGDIDVTVGGSWWRPSVLPALVTGDLDHVAVGIRDGSLLGVDVDRADYDLSGIHGDFSLLNGTVAVTSVDKGSVVIRIPPTVVGRAVGAHVTLQGGRVMSGDPPREYRAAVVNDSLVLSDTSSSGPSQRLSIAVVDPYVLPCHPGLRVLQDSLELSCTGNALPGILQSPLVGQVPTTGDDPGGQLTPPQSTVRPGR